MKYMLIALNSHALARRSGHLAADVLAASE
jgi:hypothetical protein